MSGPFTTITVNQYHMLQDIFVAADRFLKVTAEFPNDPSTWGEWMETLDTAVDKYKSSTTGGL